MKKSRRVDPGSLNDLTDELTAEAGSDDEQIWDLQQALQKNICLPCGLVILERVSVIAFECDGNQRRVVTATCRCADGRQYEVAASEVVIAPNLPGADYLAARYGLSLVSSVEGGIRVAHQRDGCDRQD